MGLLDEAIREHLELKRRAGVDPELIAAKEHEALDPIVSDEPSTWGVAHDELEGELAAGYEDFQESPHESHRGDLPLDLPLGVTLEERAVELAGTGQETEEIDMSELLAMESRFHPVAAPDPGEPVRAERLLDGADASARGR